MMQENKISIGRKSDNDVVISDDFVSGHHAILIVSADSSCSQWRTTGGNNA